MLFAGILISILAVTAAQRIFIHQQDVEITIPLSKDAFFFFDSYPVLQLKFTDLDGPPTSHYKFSLIKHPEFLSMKELTGEIYFHRDKWINQKQSNLKVTVKNLETASQAKTSLTVNIVEMAKNQFCQEHACFYDHISYFTAEFNQRKGQQEQIIGDVSPQIYRRLCEPLEAIYFFQNGTDLVSVSRSNQLEKLWKIDYELSDSPLLLKVSCELKDHRLKDVAVKEMLLNITLFDRNDNIIYVEDGSDNVDIYREMSDFHKEEVVNTSAVILFYDADSPQANAHVKFKIASDKSGLFSHRCEPTYYKNPEDGLKSTEFRCEIYFARDGQLPHEFRNCFQLKAFDQSFKKKAHATSNVCVHLLKENASQRTTVSNVENKDTTKFSQSEKVIVQQVEGICGDFCTLTLSFILILFAVATSIVFTRFWRRSHLRMSSMMQSIEQIDHRVSILSLPLAAGIETVNEQNSKFGHREFYSKLWEIEPKRIEVVRDIGEGEFGKVVLAKLQTGNSKIDVVIKTAKDINNESELTSLKKEFEQLKKVAARPHEHVIKLIGISSIGKAPWILLEFCIFESLKTYLLASRLVPTFLGTGDVDKVCSADVLSFLHQISSGMAHLADMKLVHRDLAARNVLLAEGKICKISDFGLTRNVCKSCDTYSKCSDDKVPIKYMAPESLSFPEDYTTKSDVWAFGILGYEVVMLGASPYPGIAVNHLKLFDMLTRGERMQRPQNCSQKLFAIFQSCWEIDPSNRPTFKNLLEMITEHLNAQKTQAEPLWSTPKFSEGEEIYDKEFYGDYIDKVKKARAKKMQQSSQFKSFSESSSFLPKIKRAKSMKSARSADQVVNPAYDKNFDSLEALLQRNVSDGPSLRTSPGYLPMHSKVATGSTVTATRSNQSSLAADYIQMNDFLKQKSSTTIARTFSS